MIDDQMPPSGDPTDKWIEAQKSIEINRRVGDCEKVGVAHTVRLDAHDMMFGSRVTNDAFMPVKMIVYGFMGLLATGIFGALLKLLLKTKGVG